MLSNFEFSKPKVKIDYWTGMKTYDFKKLFYVHMKWLTNQNIER